MSLMRCLPSPGEVLRCYGPWCFPPHSAFQPGAQVQAEPPLARAPDQSAPVRAAARVRHAFPSSAGYRHSRRDPYSHGRARPDAERAKHQLVHRAASPRSLATILQVSVPSFIDTNSAFRKLVARFPIREFRSPRPHAGSQGGGSCTVLLAFVMRCVAPATDSMMTNTSRRAGSKAPACW